MSIVYNCLYAFLRTNFSPDMQHSLMALNLMGPNTQYAFIMSFNANRNCRLRNYVSSECYCIRIQNTLSINTTKRTINIFCLQKATKNYITALMSPSARQTKSLNIYTSYIYKAFQMESSMIHFVEHIFISKYLSHSSQITCKGQQHSLRFQYSFLCSHRKKRLRIEIRPMQKK